MLKHNQALQILLKYWPDRHLITACDYHYGSLLVSWDNAEFQIDYDTLRVKEYLPITDTLVFTSQAKTLTTLLRNHAISEFGRNFDDDPVRLGDKT